MSKLTDKRTPFFMVEDAVFDRDLNPYELAVYMAIIKHADRQTGVAFPGVSRLATLCRMSRSQVLRCITALETKNLIAVTRDTRPEQGEKRSRQANHYTVLNISQNGGGSTYQTLGVVSTGHHNQSQLEPESKDSKEKDSPSPQNGEGVIPPVSPPQQPDPPTYLDRLAKSADVVHFKDVMHLWDKATQTWQDDRYVYIGRANLPHRLPASHWQNPFPIDDEHPRAEVIEQYHKHLLTQPDLLAKLPELTGKILVCWCRPESCHGDVLAALLANEAPKIRPRDPWYDAIERVWGYTGSMNGTMRKLLEGTNTLNGFKQHRFDGQDGRPLPVTDPQEILDWREWWYNYDRDSEGRYFKLDAPKSLHVLEKRMELASSFGAFRKWKGSQDAPAPESSPPAYIPPLDEDWNFAVFHEGRWLGVAKELLKDKPEGMEAWEYIESLRTGG